MKRQHYDIIKQTFQSTFKDFVVIALIISASTFFALFSGILMKIVIDRVLPTLDLSLMTKLGLLALFWSAFEFCLLVSQDTSLLKSKHKFMLIYTNKILESYLRLDLSKLEKGVTGETFSKIYNTMWTWGDALDNYMFFLFWGCFNAFSISFLLGFISMKVLAAVLLLFPVQIAIELVYLRKIKLAHLDVAREYNRYQGLLHNYTDNIKWIRLNQSSAFFQNQLNRCLTKYVQARRSLEWKRNVKSCVQSFMFVLNRCCIFLICMSEMKAEQLSLGDSFLVIFLLHFFYDPIGRLPGVWDTTLHLLGQLKLADPLIEAPPSRRDTPSMISAPKQPTMTDEKMSEEAVFCRLEIEGLSYGYGERRILSDVNLNFEFGKIYGITGPSGCGKSTLLKLIAGYYQPERGRIALYSPNESPPEPIRSGRVQYSSQKLHFFTDTLEGNITLDRPLHPDRIRMSLKNAALEPVLEHLPQGLETMLDPKAPQLSGGQLQRLSLARALYSTSSILLLDEATSSLDPLTEQKILDNLTTYTQQGNLVILVSHNKSALQACDIVIDLGTSNHSTLVKT